MRHLLWTIFSGFLMTVTIQAAVPTQKKAPPSCDNQRFNETHFQMNQISDWNSLPKALLVAESAEFSVQTKDGFKTKTTQSFTTGKKSLLCLTHTQNESANLVSQIYSQYAPTLIDNTETKSIGTTYWQFQVLRRGGGDLRVWNSPSPIMSREAQAGKSSYDRVQTEKWYQDSENGLLLEQTRDFGHRQETLKVRYRIHSR